MYEEVESGASTSWNQVEDRFLSAMFEFDSNLPAAFVGDEDTKKQQSKGLSGALQNGKGDWFNNLIAVLLERCSQVETLYLDRFPGSSSLSTTLTAFTPAPRPVRLSSARSEDDGNAEARQQPEREAGGA